MILQAIGSCGNAEIFEPKVIPFYEEFSLTDGYKPWDPTVPYKIATAAEQIFKEKVPGDPAKIFGAGWWRYDPEEASKLLEAQGFYKDADGKWHLPNGDPWKITIVSAAETQHKTDAFAVAEQWKKFGIETFVDTPAGAVFTQRYQLGDFDAASLNPLCTVMPDTTTQWSTLHKKWYKPIGEVATGNQFRWVNDNVSKLLDEMEKLPFNDPKCVDLSIEILKVLTKEMPITNMFHGSKLICCDNYVWENIPVGENNYAEAHWWSGNWLTAMVLPFIRSTGNAPSDEHQKEAVVPQIPVEDITGALSELRSAISNLNSQTSNLSTQISTLSSQMNNLMYVAIMEVALLIIIVVVVLLIRGRKL
jgi:peptide/nickel transport system substrate-binding protein